MSMSLTIHGLKRIDAKAGHGEQNSWVTMVLDDGANEMELVVYFSGTNQRARAELLANGVTLPPVPR